jgi:hypothetical protein
MEVLSSRSQVHPEVGARKPVRLMVGIQCCDIKAKSECVNGFPKSTGKYNALHILDTPLTCPSGVLSNLFMAIG